jgi:hypothetical protein
MLIVLQCGVVSPMAGCGSRSVGLKAMGIFIFVVFDLKYITFTVF